jgi:hypothetical protein
LAIEVTTQNTVHYRHVGHQQGRKALG